LRPFGQTTLNFAPSPALEAAPARVRVRFLAIALFALLSLLAGRAIQLAFTGDPLARTQGAQTVPAISRADITDRNGVLLATTVRAYALTATPSRVWNADETAGALLRMFPDLNRADTVRRLRDRERDVVYLRRGLTPAQREAVLTLGLGGIGFETEDRRVYPQGTMAAHAIGFTDVDLNPLAGAERGLDAQIRAAGAVGRALALSLDVRVQYALETELESAARAAGASGASAILLDARSGETLALVSWPSFDPNNAGAAPASGRRDRVAGDLHELGSTIKPFTIAMALDEQVTNSAETFDVSRPFALGRDVIEDHERIEGLASLREILARSSNIGAARLALRLGAGRQRSFLQRLGLLSPTSLEIGRNQAPLAPQAQGRRDVAGIGYGYGLATTQAALAGAYTVFANEGALVRPTLLRRAPEDAAGRTPVFSPQTTRQVLSYLRYAVTNGTGRAADVRGLQVAGKTGTAEKLGEGAAYDESRNFSSFAGVFPASDPRYVIVVSLDDVHAGQVGGAVAAPVVARVLTRAAPMLGLRAEPRAER
jgi:cell division protein FtsI (penicillin-binding protein 3)